MAIEKDLSLANRLISALPAPERALFLEYCELVELKLDKVMIEAGQSLVYAYFPVDGMVSVVVPADDAPDALVAMVGNEGMFPVSLVVRGATSAFTCKVQGAGRAFRIQRGRLQFLQLDNEGVSDVLNRYVDVCQSQLARQAVCMNYHTVRQRLARWLLMTRDRTHSSELFLTHQALAFMIGVRRESVSRMARVFEERGLISYSHGYLMLLDGAGLEQLSCRCYQANLLTYEKTLGILAKG